MWVVVVTMSAWGNGRGMDARRDEAGDVGHVDEQQRADAVGDRRHPLEVEDPRVGGRAGHDHLRANLGGLASSAS